MMTVFRYRAMKPRDGKVEFVFHRDGTILGFTEHWHKDSGWEVVVDVLVDTSVPVERRKFFLCTGGDDLTKLGENAFAYHVGTHENKGYRSYLFDVTHLPDQVVQELEASWDRLQRPAPGREDLSHRAKQALERRERLEEKRKRINERAERDRKILETTGAATDAIMQSREAAEVEREAIEQAHLRVV